METYQGVFSQDGRYFTVCCFGERGNNVRVYDVTLEKRACILTLLGTEISAAIYDKGSLIYSIKKDNGIYEWLSGSEQLIALFSEHKVCKLVGQVRGTMNLIVELDNKLRVYSREKKKILYPLPLQENFIDCVLQEGTDNITVMGFEQVVSKGNEDANTCKYLQIMNFISSDGKEVGEPIGYQTSYEWNGLQTYPMGTWPLTKYTQYIPWPMKCSSYGNYRLFHSEENVLYITDSEGAIYRILSLEDVISEKEEIFDMYFNEKDRTIMFIIVRGDRMIAESYSVPYVQDKELVRIQHRYEQMTRLDKNNFTPLYYKLMYKYGGLQRLRVVELN